MDAAVAGAADISRYGRRIVRMIWDPEPTNDTAANSPVWCLGSSYVLEPGSSDKAAAPAGTADPDSKEAASVDTAPPPQQTQPEDSIPASTSSSLSSSLAYEESGQDGGWPPAFLHDFEARIWMTYRSGFQPIPRSADPKASTAMSFTTRLRSIGEQNGFSSDTGWGCMIRSGQSLLANAQFLCQLGRDWRRGTAPTRERQILAQFADDPRAPFSIHNFVKHGAEACGKYPGEWFGPSATARCIQALVNAQNATLKVYSTDTPDVYEDSFMAVANPDGTRFNPTLILVGTRLGIDKINMVYWESLISALQVSQSVGIAGGRPSSSHYFVGTQRAVDDQGSFLFYLDPHQTRPALPYHEDPEQYSQEDIDSCHSRRLRRLHVREMDPSMLIGYLIMDEEDWEAWKSSIKHVQGKSILTVSPHDPAGGMTAERQAAIDEVETFSDDDGDTILDTT